MVKNLIAAHEAHSPPQPVKGLLQAGYTVSEGELLAEKEQTINFFWSNSEILMDFEQ